jgi:hypothetical protein
VRKTNKVAPPVAKHLPSACRRRQSWELLFLKHRVPGL